MTKDEELEQLRQENSALREQVARLSERISVLETQLAKDSHNSHLPPSSDRFHRQPKSLRKKSGKQPGGQSGHPGNTLKLSETPDQVIVHPVDHCQYCQHDLRQVASLQVERRQVIDLPAKRVLVIEHQLKAALSRAEVLHQDETGLYVAGQRHWMHVHATEHLTHYAVHPQRGKAALDAIGILANFQGVSVHDGWQSYWQFLCQHALCNVHHLRELTFLDEEQGQAWAAQMKALLLESKAAVEQARAEGRSCLHPLEVADWKARYATLLAQGYQANPPDTPPETAKKGRRKQSTARNLLDRLSKHQEAVLLFLDNFAVPFDSSLAERAILMVKV